MTTLTKFPAFSKLPAELRYAIWEAALPDAHPVIFTYNHAAWTWKTQGSAPSRRIHTFAPELLPAIFFGVPMHDACFESRVILRRYMDRHGLQWPSTGSHPRVFKRTFNPDSDMLYVPYLDVKVLVKGSSGSGRGDFDCGASFGRLILPVQVFLDGEMGMRHENIARKAISIIDDMFRVFKTLNEVFIVTDEEPRAVLATSCCHNALQTRWCCRNCMPSDKWPLRYSVTERDLAAWRFSQVSKALAERHVERKCHSIRSLLPIATVLPTATLLPISRLYLEAIRPIFYIENQVLHAVLECLSLTTADCDRKGETMFTRLQEDTIEKYAQGWKESKLMNKGSRKSILRVLLSIRR